MKPFKLLAFLFLLVSKGNAQILISDSVGTRDSSAAFEIRSSKGGFLMPRMSTEQRKAIKNPAPGLTVFDTTRQKFYGYVRGEGWRPFLMGFDTVVLSSPSTPVDVIDNLAGDGLGASVTIFGNFALAGAPSDDVNGKIDQGSVYLFKQENGVWTNIQKLTAFDGAAGDQFGLKVLINGSWAFVSAPYDDIGENLDEGSVYIYKIQGDTLKFRAKVNPDEASANDLFGYSLASQGNSLLIGAPNDDIGSNIDQGSAYAFFLDEDEQWIELQKIIQDSAASSQDYFGHGISIDNNMVSIGCHISTSGNYGYSSNAVFIYENVFGLWQRRQKIVQPDQLPGNKSDAFGYSTHLKDGILTVGAWLHNIPEDNKDRGSLYVFKKNGNSWTSIQKVTPLDTYLNDTYGDYIGSNLAIENGIMIAGSGYEDLAGGLIDRGAFYMYEWKDGKWVQKKKVTSLNPTSLDLFGHRLDMQGGNIIVSAYNADGGKGKIYFYTLED